MISLFSSYKAPSRPIASSQPQASVRFSGADAPHPQDDDEMKEFIDSFKKRMSLQRSTTSGSAASTSEDMADMLSQSVASIKTTASMDAYDRMGVRKEYLEQPERSNVPEMTPADKKKYRATTSDGRFFVNGQPLVPMRQYSYVTDYHRITTLFPRDKQDRDDGKGYQHCSVNSKADNIGTGEIRETRPNADGKIRLFVSNASGGYYPTSKHLSQIEDTFLNYYDLTGYDEITFQDIAAKTSRKFENKDGMWQLKQK